MASSNEEKDLDTREHAQAIRQRQLDGCKNLNMLEQQTVAPTKVRTKMELLGISEEELKQPCTSMAECRTRQSEWALKMDCPK